MDFRNGIVGGVMVRPLAVFTDERGWLSELFREDELPDGFHPRMGYISSTDPGVTRGPHEHREQTDYFCFFGSFVLYLWDNRTGSATYGNRTAIRAAEKKIIVVPPGIVHAYTNAGAEAGFVLNFPDRLYGGRGRKETVDEIRYENDPQSPFVPF